MAETIGAGSRAVMAALCETFFPSLDGSLAREAGEESVAVLMETGAHSLEFVVDEVDHRPCPE